MFWNNNGPEIYEGKAHIILSTIGLLAAWHSCFKILYVLANPITLLTCILLISNFHADVRLHNIVKNDLGCLCLALACPVLGGVLVMMALIALACAKSDFLQHTLHEQLQSPKMGLYAFFKHSSCPSRDISRRRRRLDIFGFRVTSTDSCQGPCVRRFNAGSAGKVKVPYFQHSGTAQE